MRRPSPGDWGSGSRQTQLLSQIALVLRHWPWWNQQSGSTALWLHDRGEGLTGQQHPLGGCLSLFL